MALNEFELKERAAKYTLNSNDMNAVDCHTVQGGLYDGVKKKMVYSAFVFMFAIVFFFMMSIVLLILALWKSF